MLASLGPGRVAPELLTGLREVDPDADLIHLGGREWLLGVRRPNPAAKARLDEELAAQTAVTVTDAAERALVASDMGKRFQLLQFFADGFRPIHLYLVDGAPGADILEDFRLRNYNWRVRPEAAFRELQESASFDVQDRKRTAVVREYFQQEARSLFRHFFAKAKSVLVPSTFSHS